MRKVWEEHVFFSGRVIYWQTPCLEFDCAGVGEGVDGHKHTLGGESRTELRIRLSGEQ